MPNTSKIMIELTDEERAALLQFAKQERRAMRDQAAIIIRQQLIALGWLKAGKGAEV